MYKTVAIISATLLLGIDVTVGASQDRSLQAARNAEAQGRRDWANSIWYDWAHKGNAEAQYKVGLARLRDDTRIGNTQALKWMTLSAQQGYTDAQFRLARFYVQGTGVELDSRQAFKWYLRAAQQGHREARLHVGVRYETGQGVTENKTEALKWYLLCVNDGNPAVHSFIADIYDSEELTIRDRVKAIQWYKSAASLGYGNAQYKLGLKYELGQGVDLDRVKAYKLYRSAAGQNVDKAIYRLGQMYEVGDVVPLNFVRAYAWFMIGGDNEELSTLTMKMNRVEIEAGYVLARECRSSSFRDCESDVEIIERIIKSRPYLAR